LTELGAKSEITVAARRASSAFSGTAILIMLVWLLKGFLGISSYSPYLLLAALGFLFLDRLLRTRTNSGAAKTLSSFWWNMFVLSIYAILMILILSYVEPSGFPKQLSALIPDLVIAALVTGVLAYVSGKVTPRRETIRSMGKPMRVGAGTSVRLGAAQLSTANDGVAIPMSLSKSSSGYVLFSDMLATLETPMGTKEIKYKSPVVISGIPFSAKKSSEEEVQRLSGKSSKELIEDAKSIITAGWGWGNTDETRVDLPFIHVNESMGESDVEVGPISVHSDSTGDHVNIGPFSIDSEERHHSKHGDKDRWAWFAFTKIGSNISSRIGTINAKWNGSSLSLKGAYMRLAVGGDGFEYDPHEIKTTSPLHTLRIMQSVISLETSRFAVNVYPSRVLVRTAEGKTKSTESQQLANDLKEALTALAMKQVKDLIAGEPIDLEEMLTKTEGVLTRYA
jgi:hypothetical protein